jgi:hypothetical protein
MAVHHATARKLATQTEWTLLQSSYGRPLDALSDAQLKQKVARTRTLRDKYRALAKQQRGEARGKRKPKSTRAAQGNANTKLKAAMFAEALGRFQERAAELKDSAKATATKAAKKKASKTTSKKTSKAAGTKGTKQGVKKAVKRAGAKPAAKKRPLTFAPPAVVASPAEVESPSNPWAAFAAPTDLSLKAQSKESRGARKALKFSHLSTSAHLGHVGSRGRRNQAKRDTK